MKNPPQTNPLRNLLIFLTRTISMQVSRRTLNDFLNTMPAVLYEYILDKNKHGSFVYMSNTTEEILGHPPQYFIEDMNRFWGICHPEDLTAIMDADRHANATNTCFVYEARIILPSGKTHWIRGSSKPTKKKKNGSTIWSGYLIDISAQKKAENELNILRNILPLCSYCKKVRDEKGGWEQVDVYIAKNSETNISHGICPDCANAHFPELPYPE